MKASLAVLLILTLFACNSPTKNEDSKKNDVVYSFFAAGHTYGNPMHHQYGLYPPFAHQIDAINKDTSIKFGFLTGDVVAKPTLEYWDTAFIDIARFNKPVYIAPGNHDRGFEFENRNLKYYYSFNYNKASYISLSPSNWNIIGEQLTFLDSCISHLPESCNHLFIFTHELIWWSPSNEFSSIEINYEPHYPGSSNYWEEIHPRLSALEIPVTIIAGDVGCINEVSPHSYHKVDNVNLISSGMGGGKRDNYLRVDILKDGSVDYWIHYFGTEKLSDIKLN